MRDTTGVQNSGYYQYDQYSSGDWRYISETWCNLQGQYTHIVRDFADVYASATYYYPSLCSVGVMGTKYVRNTPAPTTATVIQGQTSSFVIENIVSDIAIGNILDINLRQDPNSPLAFVGFTEEQG